MRCSSRRDKELTHGKLKKSMARRLPCARHCTRFALTWKKPSCAAFPAAQPLKFGGFLGVELFFVLSGFLIGSIMLHSASDSRTLSSWVPLFWSRRWLRTLPNYRLFLLINIIIPESIRPAEIPNLIFYPTFTKNFAWPHPVFFGEAWSLAVEEIFYSTTPLFIISLLYIGSSPTQAILNTACIVIVSCTTLRLLSLHLNNPPFDDGLRKIAVLRLDAIMIGVTTSVLLAKNLVNRKTMRLLSIGLTSLFIFTAYLASKPDAYLNNSHLIRAIIFTTVSLGGAGLIIAGLEISLWTPLSSITSRISRWSYSAYLVNLPILMLIKFFFPSSSSTSLCGLSRNWWTGS